MLTQKQVDNAMNLINQISDAVPHNGTMRHTVRVDIVKHILSLLVEEPVYTGHILGTSWPTSGTTTLTKSE